MIFAFLADVSGFIFYLLHYYGSENFCFTVFGRLVVFCEITDESLTEFACNVNS